MYAVEFGIAYGASVSSWCSCAMAEIKNNSEFLSPRPVRSTYMYDIYLPGRPHGTYSLKPRKYFEMYSHTYGQAQ